MTKITDTDRIITRVLNIAPNDLSDRAAQIRQDAGDMLTAKCAQVDDATAIRATRLARRGDWTRAVNLLNREIARQA